MTIRQWLANKIVGKEHNSKQGVITDDMRERALMLRRQEHALKAKEKEVGMMERILNIETQSNPKESITDTLLKQALPILMQKMQGEQGQAQPQNFPSAPVIDVQQESTSQPSFSQEQIIGLLDANPNLRKHAKSFDDEQIKEYIMTQIPNIAPECVNQIIIEVRK